MRNNHLLPLAVVILTAAVSSSTAVAVAVLRGDGDDLIGRMCRENPDPWTCESTLRSNPRSAGAETLKDLIRIMIDVVQVRFSDSLGYVRDLEKKESGGEETGGGSAVTKALKDCERRFRVVVEKNVMVAASSVNLGIPRFGENAMSDSAVEAAACQSEVDELKEEKSTSKAELVQMSRLLNRLASVAAAMFKMLE